MDKEKFFKWFALIHILITMISDGLGFPRYMFFDFYDYKNNYWL